MALTALFVYFDWRSEMILPALREYGVDHFLHTNNWRNQEALVDRADLVVVCSKEIAHREVQFIRWMRKDESRLNKPLLLACQKVDMDPESHGVDEVVVEPIQNNELPSLLQRVFQTPQNRTNLDTIEPFLESIKKIFSHRGILLNHSRPLYLLDECRKAEAITGMISFSGKSQGSLLISMEREEARQVVSTVFSIEEVGEEFLQDGVGELANMIVGNAKKALKERDISIHLSIPNVIVGENYCISRPHFKASVYSYLTCELASIFLNVALTKEKTISREQ